MNIYSRTLSCATLLSMALAGLSQLRPAWATDMSLDWWNLPPLLEQIRSGELAMAEMQPRCAAVLTQSARKEEATQDLLAGRRTLLQTAARFSKIGGPPADSIAGATREERVCRQVIGWAAAAARDQSPGAEVRTRRRLEAELDELIARHHGAIKLPDR